jgi:signal transduction histidine kinase
VNAALRLADFVATRKSEIIARWADRVATALSLSTADAPQLVDDVPAFLDDLVVNLREGGELGTHRASARAHGRQRKRIGLDIGALALEFSLVAETVLEIAVRHAFVPSLDDVVAMFRMVSQGTEQSVTEYAALRDHQLEEAAAHHYSFVAHELRVPLQNARLATDLLVQGRGETAALVDRLARALDHVASVVDSSLLGSRLRTSPSPRYERCDARVLLHDAVEACHFAAERRGIPLTIVCEDFELEVDRKLVTSLLTNLLSNAVKFTLEGQEVNLRGATVDGRARFEIADHCGGMPEDLPGRLFQPHLQEGSDRSGFGLGLAIVKQAVDAHGGTVRVVNEPGVRCSFVVDLPLSKLEEPRPE